MAERESDEATIAEIRARWGLPDGASTLTLEEESWRGREDVRALLEIIDRNRPHVLPVSHCDDCPFVRYYGGACEHPNAIDANEQQSLWGVPPPEWCPLRKAPNLVSICHPADAGGSR